MATLVRDFLLGVSTTLQDIKPQGRRWPERELVYYANFAQRALAKYLPHLSSAIDPIRLAPGTKQDLTRVLAANIKASDGSTVDDRYGIAFVAPVRNMGADGLTPGRAVRVVDRAHKDSSNPDWHIATADTVVREAMHDRAVPLTFFVSPPVHPSTAVWMDIEWMREPRRISDTGVSSTAFVRYAADGSGGGAADVMGIRDAQIEDAHNYVVAMALLKGSKNTANVPKAQLHAATFLQSLNAQVQALTGTNPNLKAFPFLNEIREST